MAEAQGLKEVLLFVATRSKLCEPVMRFVVDRRVPVNVIRLDSEFIRNAVAKGPHFQITHVPSLVAILTDGTVQVFIGAPKIIDWLTSATTPRAPPPPPQRRVEGIGNVGPVESGPYGETSQTPPPRPMGLMARINPPRPQEPTIIEDDLLSSSTDEVGGFGEFETGEPTLIEDLSAEDEVPPLPRRRKTGAKARPGRRPDAPKGRPGRLQRIVEAARQEDE